MKIELELAKWNGQDGEAKACVVFFPHAHRPITKSAHPKLLHHVSSDITAKHNILTHEHTVAHRELEEHGFLLPRGN